MQFYEPTCGCNCELCQNKPKQSLGIVRIQNAEPGDYVKRTFKQNCIKQS